MSVITQQDILDALQRSIAAITHEGEAGVTALEFAEFQGVSDKTARDQIKKLLRDGKAEVVKVARVRMDGKPCHVSGYRLKG